MRYGGEFLTKQTLAEEIFVPEEWNEEQRMVAQTCRDFLEAEVFPKLDEIDSMQHPELMPSLLEKAGELGLLATSVPEKYGGFNMDFNTTMLVAEETGAGHSFAVASSAHSGIGTLPILYYGTSEQKAKYIPKLSNAEWKAAYCLTEPDSGSDAMAAKTKATLSADGKHYLLNGQKMWITNGGFADLLIVFAKIDDDENLTAFIVEKAFGGITMNEEEKKMGIKGSSTRQLFFNDCPVPVENLLFERGKGFKIAVNILNIGRIKLAAAALGGSKRTTSLAVGYANERKQFGVLISSFGALKHKMAMMATKIYASEAACYRASNNIQNIYKKFIEEGETPAQARLKALEEYAIECAILKVHSSEVLDYVTDEGVQIYGGMGYSADAPMDRAYRDSRINRIFEGANEINRLLTVDMLMKRALKGRLDVMGPAMAVQKELMSVPDFSAGEEDGLFVAEKKVLANLKKATLVVAGAAVQKLMQKLSDEQEILMAVADMLIEIYAAESVLLRVEKVIGMEGEAACAIRTEMARIYLYEAVDVVSKAGKEAVYAFSEGDELKMLMLGLKRFTKTDPYNLKNARRKVAEYLIEKNGYPF